MEVAEELARLGQRVTAIDVDADKVRKAQTFVHQAFAADATRPGVLAALGLADVDVGVVSLGDQADRASQGVLHLSDLGVRQIVTKAKNEEHANLLACMGASQVVFPEKELALRVGERLGSRHVLSYVPLGAGFAVLEVAAPVVWTGQSLADLDLGRVFGVQVLAVREFVPERTIAFPQPDQVVKDSDALVILGPDAAIKRVCRLDVRRRQFAVIGIGRFGYHLVRSLYEMGHDVLAVDGQEEAVQQISPFCSQAVVADASDERQLWNVGAAEAQVGVVAIGTRLDVSILATLHLREASVREIVAKAGSPAHARILHRLGAGDVIRPERDSALLTARRLAEPTVLERLPFLEGYAISEVCAPRPFWGKTLAETQLRRAYRLSVVLVKRVVAGEERTLAAGPDERLREGDVLTVFTRPDDLAAFRRAYPE